MDGSDAKRLKALEDENEKPKKLLADQMPEASALRELLSKKMEAPASKREAVAHRRSAWRWPKGCPTSPWASAGIEADPGMVPDAPPGLPCCEPLLLLALQLLPGIGLCGVVPPVALSPCGAAS